MNVETIARVCHEANRAYCQTLGDFTQNEWHNAPEWQKDSARAGVQFHLAGNHGPAASHENWMKQKLAEGWVHGPHKDAVTKTHPCLVPFEELPPEQQAKDRLFRSIVHAFKKPGKAK